MSGPRCGASSSAFGFGAIAGMALGAISGASGLMRNLLDPTLQALRSVPFDRLGAAVHPVVWNLRDIQSGADRRRRVLPCLSRRGAGHSFRSIASWWRSGAPSGSRALPWPGASCCRRSCRKRSPPCARGARPRLHVRRRGGIHGCLGGARLSGSSMVSRWA